MKWFAGLAVTLALVTAGLTVEALLTQHVLGIRVASVNKDRYVAANEDALRHVPVYANLPLANRMDIGISAPDGLFNENGPPYDHYYTWHAYELPPATSCEAAADYYKTTLPRSGWRWIGGQPEDASYVRAHGLVHVSCSRGTLGRPDSLLLSLDHAER